MARKLLGAVLMGPETMCPQLLSMMLSEEHFTPILQLRLVVGHTGDWAGATNDSAHLHLLPRDVFLTYSGERRVKDNTRYTIPFSLNTVCACAYGYMCVQMYACLCRCMCAYGYICAWVYVCAYGCMYVPVWVVCACVHAHGYTHV